MEHEIVAFILWPSDVVPSGATNLAFERAYQEVLDFLAAQFGRPIRADRQVQVLMSPYTHAEHAARDASINLVLMEILPSLGVPTTGPASEQRMVVAAVVGGGAFAGSFPPEGEHLGLAVLGDAFLDPLTQATGGIFPGNTRTCETWLGVGDMRCTPVVQTGALADEMSHLFGIGPFHRPENEYWRYPAISLTNEEQATGLLRFAAFFVTPPTPPPPSERAPAGALAVLFLTLLGFMSTLRDRTVRRLRKRRR